MSKFSEQVLAWFEQYGRHDLPWQKTITPYRVWVSEIMLQQTQVKTVIPYYERFMRSFPTVEALAQASQDAVLAHWAGLGYYARGRNLHKSAIKIMADFEGQFPEKYEDILALSGIGCSTAGAILSIALQQRYTILDGNVKRVLSRYLALEGWTGSKENERFLWQKAEAFTPALRFADYTQAIMDLGATVCTRTKPRCEICPVKSGCLANQQDRVSHFPVAKPKKEKPIKQAYFLVLENTEGKVFLQQRPQKGIWGGLWSFPEYESRQMCLAQIKKYESQTMGLQSLVEWNSFRHTFSHYHLDIFPMIVQSIDEKQALQILQVFGNGEWGCKAALNSNQATLGVPAPVTKLVRLMRESEHV
ncbi:A/G-specific adenine glycosylase [hydrothermal vent metagenome]|uniref:Adenine DNA glycosylase n=1 Tax=hydrothermal vent metagenome TaxID=652676 RepID=A0A3B0VMX5_9ZZZZ